MPENVQMKAQSQGKVATVCNRHERTASSPSNQHMSWFCFCFVFLRRNANKYIKTYFVVTLRRRRLFLKEIFTQDSTLRLEIWVLRLIIHVLCDGCPSHDAPLNHLSSDLPGHHAATLCVLCGHRHSVCWRESSAC